MRRPFWLFSFLNENHSCKRHWLKDMHWDMAPRLAALMLVGCGVAEAMVPAAPVMMRRPATRAPRHLLGTLRAQEPAALFPEPPPPKDGDYVDSFCRGEKILNRTAIVLPRCMYVGRGKR
jgi:hypothetical protein